MTTGSVVRIRSLTPDGTAPIRAVIEVDRRAGTARASGATGSPPPILAVEGDTEAAVMQSLLPFAEEDASLARLLAERGIR
ncbi:MAG: hypothetical protein K2X99_09420 [Gemmatimonadaceae bacterium]|nr:hypothetical protein [Gemmatimonadaceae bacterium]